MTIPRIYQPSTLNEGEEIVLSPLASHHVMHVLRLALNDPLIVFTGKGGEFVGHISQVTAKAVKVLVEKFDGIERESSLQMILAQGISRTEKMDFIIQKAVELGVGQIFPIIAERTQGRLNNDRSEKRLAHWRNIVIHACEQCGRNRIPLLHSALPLSEWLSQVSAPHRWILDPSGDASLSSREKVQDVAILIGPEGGWSSTEIQLAKQYQFRSIRLGPRILRTETAPLAIMAILQAQFGDLGS